MCAPPSRTPTAATMNCWSTLPTSWHDAVEPVPVLLGLPIELSRHKLRLSQHASTRVYGLYTNFWLADVMEQRLSTQRPKRSHLSLWDQGSVRRPHPGRPVASATISCTNGCMLRETWRGSLMAQQGERVLVFDNLDLRVFSLCAATEKASVSWCLVCLRPPGSCRRLRDESSGAL
jgi:hypothetical protein